MKIKSIAAICKKRHVIALYDEMDGRTQWIGDGVAIYPLYGMPELDEDTVLTVLDVSDKDRDKYIVRRCGLPTAFCFDDDDDSEMMLPNPLLTIGYGGELLMPARTSCGLRFVDPTYLKPIAEDNPVLFERTGRNGIYIAAKGGMLLQAVILPSAPDEGDLLQRLDTLRNELEARVTYRQQYEDADTGQIEIDEETGEVINS